MKRVLTILLTFLVLNAALLYAVIWQGKAYLYDENNLIENLQAACYLSATFCAAWALAQLKGFERWLAGVFTLACVTFFLREVDVAELDIAPTLQFIFGGQSKDVLMAALFAALIGRFFWAFRDHLRDFWKIASSRIALLVIGGCALLAIGSFFEEVSLPLFEEMSELNGALLILSAAFLYALAPGELTSKTAAPQSTTGEGNRKPIALS